MRELSSIAQPGRRPFDGADAVTTIRAAQDSRKGDRK